MGTTVSQDAESLLYRVKTLEREAEQPKGNPMTKLEAYVNGRLSVIKITGNGTKMAVVPVKKK